MILNQNFQIIKLKIEFSQDKNCDGIIFQILKILFYLNFKSPKFQKNQRNFYLIHYHD